MKSRILLFMIMTFVLLPILQESHACSCASPVDYVGATMESEYAFIGTVTHIDNSDGPQKVYFDVDSVIKGDISDGKFVLENTGIVRQGDTRTESSCDVGYQAGMTYNVFVFDNSFMNNSMCSTKAIGFLGIMNPLQYNLFYITILVLIITAIAITIVLIIRRKRK